MSAFVINSYAFGGEDPDAKAYLDAVETADTQALEAGVRKAVDDFVIGLKADGIWSAIKASCILAGARTLTGALTPLVGSAPTNIGNNFVSGDYDREDGLLGDGTTKALDSNRANNADPQNDNHNALYVSSVGTANRAYMGAGGNVAGTNSLIADSVGSPFVRNRNSTGGGGGSFGGALTSGFYGTSRAASSSFNARAIGTSITVNVTSQSPNALNLIVFARGEASSLSIPTDARIAFYSIGESLDLADFDTRVSTLMTDLAAAI